MYLNVNLAANASGAGGDSAMGSCTTPRTPDILNLLAGAPFDNFGSFGGGGSAAARTGQHSFAPYFPPVSSSLTPGTSSSSGLAIIGTGAASTPGDGPASPGEHASSSFSSLSSMCSSPATPSTPPGNGPPSIQNTRTYLIKEGLKLTIQSKRLASGRGSLDADQLMHKPVKDEMGHLTTEDEERRRRRRERNKVAATKCRNRKKERTGILMKESDVLEDQNSNFRSEIQRLESEKRRLLDVLAKHSSNCLKTPNSQTPVSCSSDFGPSNGNISQPSHYTHANPVQSSPGNYSQIYGCSRSSSEGAAMAGLAPHHSASGYDVNATAPNSSMASEPCASANYGNRSDMGFSQPGMIHRMSYGGGMPDSHIGPNYR